MLGIEAVAEYTTEGENRQYTWRGKCTHTKKMHKYKYKW